MSHSLSLRQCGSEYGSEDLVKDVRLMGLCVYSTGSNLSTDDYRGDTYMLSRSVVSIGIYSYHCTFLHSMTAPILL